MWSKLETFMASLDGSMSLYIIESSSPAVDFPGWVSVIGTLSVLQDQLVTLHFPRPKPDRELRRQTATYLLSRKE